MHMRQSMNRGVCLMWIEYQTPTIRILCLLLACCLTTGAAGCGDPNAVQAQKVYPVKGKVLLGDGSPLKSGQVVLVSSTRPEEYTGAIKDDGTFEVKTSYGDGAPEGTYKVRIDPEVSALSKSKGKPSSRKVGANLPFPARYTEESTSDLSVTVKPGENNLESFKLAK